MRLFYKISDIFRDPSTQLEEFNIEPGWRVIDYGCGPGRYLPRASKQVGPEGKVFAVDIHELAMNCVCSMVQKKRLKNVIPVRAKEYFVPIQENTANLIYVLDVFHMISQPTLFLQELHRLIRSDGKLILEDGHQKRIETLRKVEESKRWRILEEKPKHLILKPIYKIK